MARSSKSSWLEGPGDLEEADVEDVPVKGESVRVRGLPAAYSNDAATEATEVKAVEGEQFFSVNKTKMEAIQFAHGVIEPKFTYEEALQVAQKYGPAFRKVVDKIDELSAVNKEEIDSAQARFPASNGASAATVDAQPEDEALPAVAGGSGESDVHVRAGAGDEHDAG